MKKHPLIWICSLLLLLWGTGCTGQSAELSAALPPDSPSRFPESAGAPTFDTVTINFLADRRPEFQVMEKLLGDFEAETGIHVNYIPLEERQLRARTELEMAAYATDMDVVMADFLCVDAYAQKGYLADLGQLLEQNCGGPATRDYIAPFLQACSRGDTLYALPLYQDCNLMVLRWDLLQKYDLHIPTTYDELYDTARVLQDREPEVCGIVMRGAPGAGVNEWTWPTFLSGFGGQYYDRNLRAALDTPEAAAALRFYTELLRDCGPRDAASYTYREVQRDFMEGKAGILIDSATLALRCEDPLHSQVAGKLVYAPVPSLGDGTLSDTGFYSWVLCIPQGSGRKDAAARFVNWMASTPVATACGFSAPSSAMSAAYNLEGCNGVNLYDVMLDSLARSNPDYRPRSPISDQVGEIVSQAIYQALTGQQSPEDALAAANEALQQELDKLGESKN